MEGFVCLTLTLISFSITASDFIWGGGGRAAGDGIQQDWEKRNWLIKEGEMNNRSNAAYG